MIPVKLALKNFLSYGEDVPPLDFTQFHIACLSGNNGQGKSALLDALTWAVWGEGRKASQEKKADNSLLRIGQKDMQVEFVFDLEGDRYRIIRTFSLVKKGSRSSLEFQVFNQEDNKYISLTGPSLRETQERITKTLRIDYKTFINSAFILQGRIDEFSRKSARERKEILSEILGLSRYDELANLAKSHLKEINNIIMTKESRLEYIYQEMANLDFYKEKIKELSESYKDISRKIKTEEVKVSKFKEEINILKHKSEQCAELEGRIEQQRQEIVRGQKQIEFRKKEITDYEKIISQKEKVFADFKNYQKFNTENNEFSRKLQKTRKIEEEKVFIERKIESERADLEVEVRNKKDRYKDLKMKAEQGIKNRAKVLELEKKMKEIKLVEEQIEEIRQKGSKLNVEINSIKGQIERLEKDNKDNQEKLRLLRENPEGECPLCEVKLNAERKRKIEDNINKEISLNFKKVEKLKKEAEESSKQKDRLAEKWREVNQKLKDKDIWQQKLSKVHFEYEESKQAAKLIVDLQEEINKLEKTIQEKRYALEEQKRLKEIEGQIKNIGYDEVRHRQLSSRIEELSNAPLEKAKLEEAEKKIDSLRDGLSELKENYQQKELNLQDLEKKKDKIRVELKELPFLKEKLVQEEQLLNSEQILKDKILEERGGYQSKFDQCLRLGKEKKEIGKELEKSKKEQNIYEKLIVAFGKNGIQALIIENVLPEIEEEANDLLAKLTNNGTQISIESLRDLKSGGIKETLDIKISDELGIRDYELYSGGEAFRIDFSLRIALSKLLTRRAGTKLRTLVMDEGFGTQDEEGIDNLVQAIQSISEDFDKILIITHLESLKDVFPVRIEVTKLPEIGSRFEIVKN
ncbi:SMC family ATPase [Candidatus Atribacteria bacterium 1244-E10-H5-B2]|nr:MAG: SMC family ATPase [Candidatus Atribacteria bacterium 1244-E10-H5-B2]